MWLNKLLHMAEGKLTFRVECAFPERALNLLGAHGVQFWDLKWYTEMEFSCTVRRADAKKARALFKKANASAVVERRSGAPYFALRFRRRYALVTGLVLVSVFLLLGSFCIWDFEIEGETPVSEEEILRVLAENGVKLGTFGLSVDSEDLRNHALLELPELSWIAVNVSGFRAHVQVRPRIPKPEIVDAETPVNIVARRAGLVETVEPLGGEAVVLKGTTVAEGDLLISGAVDRGGAAAGLCAAMGRVEARTWYTLEASLPLTQAEKCPTGASHRVISLIFGNRRIKIFGKGSIEGEEYDKITIRTKWDIFGLLPLPVTTVKEIYTVYKTREHTASRTEAEEQGDAVLRAYLATLLDEEGSVLAAVSSAREQGGRLLVRLSAECREQIGIAEKIPE